MAPVLDACEVGLALFLGAAQGHTVRPHVFTPALYQGAIRSWEDLRELLHPENSHTQLPRRGRKSGGYVLRPLLSCQPGPQGVLPGLDLG